MDKKRVVIIGAGVDKSQGLDMPLANELITDLVKFTENDGKLISEIVKKQLPNMRFSFKNFVKSGIDGILERDNEEDTIKLVRKVENLNSRFETNRIKLFMAISGKLDSIREEILLMIRQLKLLKKFLVKRNCQI